MMKSALHALLCAGLMVATFWPAGAGGAQNDGTYVPGEALATNEMRISFMGTSFLPRLSQAANSVFVECGNGENFVFDCGAGVIEKYVAMGVAYSKMDKIFMTHLHADHMSDLMFIYCFGPSTDRKTPLYVWGPSGDTAEDGTTLFCQAMRDITEWHRESFSFLSTGLTNGLDGYDLVATECPYDLIGNEVYNTNGVRITTFPAIHDRDGAISFRLEWQGISMVFSGDSRPNTFMLNQATNLDVLIHEVTLSPEVWAAKNSGLSSTDPRFPAGVAQAKMIQDCSHTPAKALGYILNQLDLQDAAPRLAIGTHCQFEGDTTNTVMQDIRSWYAGPVALATDLVVLNVSTDKSQPIRQRTAIVSSDAFYATAQNYPTSQLAQPRYTNNMMQLSGWLQEHIIPDSAYTNPPPGMASAKAGRQVSAVTQEEPLVDLGLPPATNEMRISFMGTSVVPRMSQAANSVFVECGNGESFIFDCGAGVVEKYVAAGVAYSRMDKLFLTHLHADHMSELMFIYCFGPSTDRYTPVYVYGPTGPSTNAPQGVHTNEGTAYHCSAMRTLTKWHRDSFSFLSTGLANGQDGYDLVPYEIPYEQIGGEVYNTNGVRITSFPAIHDRDGAISFRLEWQGLSMVFSGDSRPNTFMLGQATNLDVLIHEVTLSPEFWAAKNTGRSPGDPVYEQALVASRMIQDCSHTPAKALGYILNQLDLSNAAPRLAVATHCQFEDDTTNAVWMDIRSWYTGDVALVKDLQVITVSTDKSQPIRQGIASFSSNAFYAHAAWYQASELAPPKYTNNMMQLSGWLQDHIIPARLYSTLDADVDMDGDGKMDLVVDDPSTGVWYARLSASGQTAWTVLGGPGYAVTPGDYDGDRMTDPAVYQEATGNWMVQQSASRYAMASINCGGPGYKPAPGDYDGDRKADPAVYQEATANWYVKMSGNNYVLASAGFGLTGIEPVQRDYDGDGKVDPAVYQESSGNWYVMLSAGGYGIASANFGGPGFSPAPCDFDGDGKTDLAVYQESTRNWYVMQSAYGFVIASVNFGDAGYVPVPGDFDGDLKADPTLYQALSGNWFSELSGSAYGMAGENFGNPAYAPVWLNPAGL